MMRQIYPASFSPRGSKMSWFTDLAGKAEDFLNKVDQGAATALSKNQSRTSSFSSPYEQESAVRSEFIAPAAVKADAQSSSHDAPTFIAAAAGNIKRSSATLLAGTANVPSNAANPGSSGAAANSIKSSSSFVRPKKSEQDVNDDMLFDFLNSSDPPEISRRDSRKDLAKLAAPTPEPQNPTPPPPSTGVQATLSAPSTPPSTRGVSRASSVSSLSAHSIRTSEEQTQDTPEGSDSSLALLQDSSKHGTPPPPAEEPPSQVLSSLRLENQLLRSEVASLNQEMASVIQRAKDLQEELNQARLRADRRNSEQSQNDRALRDLRSQVDDLNEALSAKDGQLAVLKVRLDEADQLLRSRNAALEEVQREKSRILQDHTEGSSMHSQALETMQERLREAESTVRREQESYRQLQTEYAGRMGKLEAERQTLAETLTAAERRAGDDKLRADELQQAARSSKAACERDSRSSRNLGS
ncbi:hypothetical protein OJAV_G00217570 [Oryzias javanicus]|uniref:Golgin subfamily A member 5 n=1 Tax=Oryzias javanicus TaxID=123683 RepID=A0A437C4H0_ORYJA|nr:hypothetical protein OJAV_G00217570 [Oryzias javanicus]